MSKSRALACQKFSVEEFTVGNVGDGKMGWIEVPDRPGGQFTRRFTDKGAAKKSQLESPPVIFVGIKVPCEIPPLRLKIRMLSMIFGEGEDSPRACVGNWNFRGQGYGRKKDQCAQPDSQDSNHYLLLV